MIGQKTAENILEKFDNLKTDGVIDISYAREVFKKRPRDSHKGTFGRLLVLAGSKGLTGAGALACRSALKAGAGLVTLACAEELNPIFEVKLTEAMTFPLKSKNGAIRKSEKKKLTKKANESTALLIGCGLSQAKGVDSLVRYVVKNALCPLVLDADALNVISKDPSVLKSAKKMCIITPHIGEFSRLCAQSINDVIKNKETLAQNFSKEYGCIVVLKSHETIVATPDGEIYKNILGNPGMATGGTGDVLAGVIASLVGQGNDMVKSALAGVFIHSLSGDIANEMFGEYSLTAGDIINCLAPAIKALG